MGKLTKGDIVLHVDINGKPENGRHQHRCIFDVVDRINGNKVKLKQSSDDNFDDNGNHGANSKKKLYKINKDLKDLMLTNLSSDIDKIIVINIDDSLLNAIEGIQK